MKKIQKFSAEKMEQAVRMLAASRSEPPSEWSETVSLVGKIDCAAESRELQHD